MVALIYESACLKLDKLYPIYIDFDVTVILNSGIGGRLEAELEARRIKRMRKNKHNNMES
ncbi:hypothetical protein OK016_11310 [Vibrio chagasii]|nr:hypothetical protein [Vibrio chagasii]